MTRSRSDVPPQDSFAALEPLVPVAVAQRDRAHAPYSKFRVGAALLTESGRVHPGCNVENASYGLSICAERNAVVRAVSEGDTTFRGIVVATGTTPPVPPCGLCRQTLVEFARDLPILLVGPNDERIRTTLAELFPNAFTPDDL